MQDKAKRELLYKVWRARQSIAHHSRRRLPTQCTAVLPLQRCATKSRSSCDCNSANPDLVFPNRAARAATTMLELETKKTIRIQLGSRAAIMLMLILGVGVLLVVQQTDAAQLPMPFPPTGPSGSVYMQDADASSPQPFWMNIYGPPSLTGSLSWNPPTFGPMWPVNSPPTQSQ
jgi:hypothetical protein